MSLLLGLERWRVGRKPGVGYLYRSFQSWKTDWIDKLNHIIEETLRTYFFDNKPAWSWSQVFQDQNVSVYVSLGGCRWGTASVALQARQLMLPNFPVRTGDISLRSHLEIKEIFCLKHPQSLWLEQTGVRKRQLLPINVKENNVWCFWKGLWSSFWSDRSNFFILLFK